MGRVGRHAEVGRLDVWFVRRCAGRQRQSAVPRHAARHGEWAQVRRSGGRGHHGATGVSSAKAITQSTSGVTGVAGKGDNFGGSLAAADGYLAVGAPWDDVESVKNTGSVQVFTVTSKGLTPVRRVSQYGSAVPGKAEPYDIFGYSVAFGPQLRGRHQPDRRRPGRSDRSRARERWCCVAGAAHLGQGLCRRPVVRGSWTVRTTALCVCGLRRRRSA